MPIQFRFCNRGLQGIKGKGAITLQKVSRRCIAAPAGRIALEERLRTILNDERMPRAVIAAVELELK